MNQTLIALNKIYRAVHDGVCPKCGNHLRTAGPGYRCFCGFYVSIAEMERMREAVVEWGKEPVRIFERWRRDPLPGEP